MRILGLKAHMGCHRKKSEQLIPSEKEMPLELKNRILMNFLQENVPLQISHHR